MQMSTKMLTMKADSVDVDDASDDDADTEAVEDASEADDDSGSGR